MLPVCREAASSVSLPTTSISGRSIAVETTLGTSIAIEQAGLVVHEGLRDRAAVRGHEL
jgi:hypothetical protein